MAQESRDVPCRACRTARRETLVTTHATCYDAHVSRCDATSEMWA